ncbi:hypothetical protein OG689_09510 [Kitasatospora sp. NBC_00240]|nr:hypothetical protein [Kitasatospora sp. NBC_00240]MCX5209518.1 hypothetical protein [Kitasatospora sp. NBC_00240]
MGRQDQRRELRVADLPQDRHQHLKVYPCMNAEDLSTGLDRLGRASF